MIHGDLDIAWLDWVLRSKSKKHFKASQPFSASPQSQSRFKHTYERAVAKAALTLLKLITVQ